MRIARVSVGGAISFGIVEGGFVAEIDGPPIGGVRLTGNRVPMSEARLLAPTLPSKIVAIGVNYRDHAEEMGHTLPEQPLMFLKPSTAVVGDGDAVTKPAVCERLDYEGELAVVVKGLVRGADAETAREAILGYTCANDITARDLQLLDGQWSRAKGFDGFCPLGPWIDTDLDPYAADIETRLNGHVRQASNTKNLIFGPAELVSYVSNVMTLLPGDVILTGTPAGVGPMEPGDTVEVEIDGIGVLSTTIA